MRKLMVFISLLLLISFVSAEENSPIKLNLHVTEIMIQTSDGLNLYAWETPSPDVQAPLFVLLPMMGHTHNSYDPFIEELYKQFSKKDSTKDILLIPHILSLDLRGHGKSTQLKGHEINYRSMEPADFKKYPLDIKAMIDRVLSEKSLRIDRNNIVVIGASIGANSAIMVTELLDNITKVVMLSPGESFHSLEPASTLTKFTGKVLIFAAENDKYSKSSSEKLSKLKKNQCTLKIYSGSDHGTNIINNNSEAMMDLIEWLIKE